MRGHATLSLRCPISCYRCTRPRQMLPMRVCAALLPCGRQVIILQCCGPKAPLQCSLSAVSGHYISAAQPSAHTRSAVAKGSIHKYKAAPVPALLVQASQQSRRTLRVNRLVPALPARPPGLPENPQQPVTCTGTEGISADAIASRHALTDIGSQAPRCLQPTQPNAHLGGAWAVTPHVQRVTHKHICST